MPWSRVLIILGSALTIAFASAQEEIVVKPGDTLWGLAQRHNTTIEALLQVNGLAGTDLMPGAVLKLPSGSTAHPESYTIQAGDTLYDIAVAFNLSVDDLIAFNNLDGALIRIGQVLALKPAASSPPAAALVVTVQPGDNLWALARQHEVSVEAIRTANNLNGSSLLRPGEQLTIPGRYAGTTDAPQGGAAAAPTITVQRGDSLWQIARHHNTTISALMSINNLRDTQLQIGQTLRIVPSNELARAAPATPAPTPAPQASPAMVWPAHGQITSHFGYRRLRINGTNFHTGLDIDGNIGDPVVSATDGIVTFSGWRGGYGNLVIIEKGGTEYYYAHASQLHVSVGEVVTAGQLIANVGATGAATGPHLHFEIRVDGTPVDPLLILEQRAQRP